MVSKAVIYTVVYVVSLVACSLYFQHEGREATKAAVLQNTNTLVSQYNKKLEDADKLFRQQTADMQDAANKQKKTKDETIASISSKLVDAISELRNRPNRPTSSASQAPNDSIRGTPCTAAELYYEDAEFLTREAARAESVLIERNYYYSRYITVQEQMNRANQ